jgi:hypothetical protein
MRSACLSLGLLLVGCAAPFTEVKSSSPREGVSVTTCGLGNATTGSVIASMEPPQGAPEERLEPKKVLRVCLRLANKGHAPVRLDRSQVQLKCPRERLDWTSDNDDTAATVHPGSSRDFYVGFSYGVIEPGEEVSVLLDQALTSGGKPFKVDPIVLRRK